MSACYRKRFLAAAFLALSLSSCVLPTSPGGGMDAIIPTPTTPLTYSFVMAYDGGPHGSVEQGSWVQIGPKVDADGTHVAIQVWQNGLIDFKEFGVPGPLDRYGVIPVPGGYALQYNGRTIYTAAISFPNVVYSMTIGERTTA